MTARRINATSNLSSPRCSSTQKPFKIAYSWPQNIGEFSWKLRRMDHNSRIIMTRQMKQTELCRRMKEKIGGGVCVGRGGGGESNDSAEIPEMRKHTFLASLWCGKLQQKRRSNCNCPLQTDSYISRSDADGAYSFLTLLCQVWNPKLCTGRMLFLHNWNSSVASHGKHVSFFPYMCSSNVFEHHT